jgi:2-polyprenyl-3-methyl-5-hydroxy-6-metoxy-1,4-benzoquinol methylase
MDISELKRIKDPYHFNRHPWEWARKKVILFLFERYVTTCNHIFDIGAGDIYILNELCKNNLAGKFSAVDNAYNDEIISYLKNSYQNPAISFYRNIEEVKIDNGAIDYILLLDVLEHCENDEFVLESIKEKISNHQSTATFIITVPAFQSLFSQHDKLLHHYRRYNRKQLRTLCTSQNLKIISEGYFFFSLLSVRVFQILLEKVKIRKAKTSLDNWKGNHLITKFISSILWIDFRICYFFSKIGLNLPGVSCYCICKKLP